MLPESGSSDESQDEVEVNDDAPGSSPMGDNADDEKEGSSVKTPRSSHGEQGDDTASQLRRSTPSSLENKTQARLNVRPETITASVYDIVPTIAAPHGTSINAITSTPDLRWVFSGGADGYIRRFNWIDTANGKSMLTVAQRHPFVDSVVKAGVLVNYCENNDDTTGRPEDGTRLSAVYSLAAQRNALWLLAGTESGTINLQSVRYEEGKRITSLRGHKSAVSALTLASDEQSVLSGSWDKTVLDWDLNTGQSKRSFTGSTGQISAVETRPISDYLIPEQTITTEDISDTFATNNQDPPRAEYQLSESTSAVMNGHASEDLEMIHEKASPDSLFGGNDGDSLFGDDEEPSHNASIGFEKDHSTAIVSQAMKNIEDSQNTTVSDSTFLVESSTDMMALDETTGADEPAISKLVMSPRAVGDTNTAIHNERLDEHERLVHSPSTEQNDYPMSKPGSECGGATDLGKANDQVFLAASIDGNIRIWDKRKPNPITVLMPHNVPPWCMYACWSPDGNSIYAGRRNGTVDEYNLRSSLHKPSRNLRLPANSGAVSAVRVMPNGRHLLCASFDILRLYDLQEQQIFKHATVPFLIVPGHRTSVISQLHIDSSCRYLISTAGNRGWEGTTSEVLLGYEINVPE